MVGHEENQAKGTDASPAGAGSTNPLTRPLRALFWRRDNRQRRLEWLLPWSPRPGVEDIDALETDPRAAKRWGFFRWPLTARILSINLLVLVIPLYGFFRADTYRASLIEAELANLAAEGRILARAVGSTADQVPAAFSTLSPGPGFENSTELGSDTVYELSAGARSILRLLTQDIDSRVRLFDQEGELMADSSYLGANSARIRIEALNAPSGTRTPSLSFTERVAQFFGAPRYPLYSEPLVDRASHYEVLAAPYEGEVATDVRVDRSGGLVFLVALPVQQYRQVIGSLLVSRNDTSINLAVQQLQNEVMRVTFLTLGVTILLSILLANTIARPIRRIAVTANRVARSKRRQVEIPDLRHRHDEIGDLSYATRRMTEALWDRLDATDAFAADVSHELKNPLTSLKSAVETIQAYPDSPRRGDLLDIVHHDVNRMDRLITDISRSSRVDAEISRMDWQEIDMTDLVGNLVEARRALYLAENKVVLQLSTDTAGGSSMVRVVGDRIAQVLNNLFDNAVTFSPEGGVVQVQVTTTPRAVRVTVLDQGPGIPADRLTRVFERFYTDRPEGDGFGNHSGLGLSIVRQIIEGHNGRIWADNADEDEDPADKGFSGAKFVFELPSL